MDAPATTPPRETGTGGRASLAANPVVPRYSYYALAILVLVNFLNYIDRQVLPVVAPYMMADPHLQATHAEIGYMDGALLLSFTVLAPLFGGLGDRYSRTKLMASAAVIWSIATALTGVVDLLPFLPASVRFQVPLLRIPLAMSGAALALCFVRALVGVGESSYSTITPSLIADYFPPQRRATALGVFQAAIPMGFSLGFVISAVLAYFFGWRLAFMIVGVPGIVAAVLVWRLREPARGATDEHAQHTLPAENTESSTETALPPDRAEAREPWPRTAWTILRTRDWFLATAGYTALTFALGAFSLWATVLLHEDKKMSELSAGVTLGIVALSGGAAGTFGGGWLADRVVEKRRNGYFLVCAVATLLGIVPALLALISNDRRIYLPSIFFAVLLLFVSNGPFHAILVNSVPPLLRATAVALNIVIIHTCGDLISRVAVGVLSDALRAGHLPAFASLAYFFGIDARQQSLSAALLVAPAALILSTLFFFTGASKQKTEGSKQ